MSQFLSRRVLPIEDIFLEISRGTINNACALERYGKAPDVSSGVEADVWDREAVQPQHIGLNVVQTFEIVSDDAGDELGGPGARTLRIFGLPTWDDKEVFEDIELDGLTPVVTARTYVGIHFMTVLTKGSVGVNLGTITSTASVAAQVGAQINPGEGETQMAILGVPSLHTAFLTGYHGSALSTGPDIAVAIKLLVNPEPDVEPRNFITRSKNGLMTAGANYIQHVFRPVLPVPGPAIIKISTTSTKNNTEVNAGFSGVLIDN